MFNTLLNILFPESCPLCSNPVSVHKTAPLCESCWTTIVPYEGPACRRCGRPFTSDAASICFGCLQDEPLFASARSFGLYSGALRKAINLLKYHNIKRLAVPLAEIIRADGLPQVDAVLPVPLHIRRLRQREFNQSALIAKYLAKGTETAFVPDCLIKIRDTKPQVGLSSVERRKNMKNAFGIRKKEKIQGKRLLLVDDVSTTGATVRECAGVLKRAGAGDVHVFTLAHGMQD